MVSYSAGPTVAALPSPSYFFSTSTKSYFFLFWYNQVVHVPFMVYWVQIDNIDISIYVPIHNLAPHGLYDFFNGWRPIKWSHDFFNGTSQIKRPHTVRSGGACHGLYFFVRPNTFLATTRQADRMLLLL